MKRLLSVFGLLLAIGLLLGAPGTASALPSGNYVLEFNTNASSPGSASISYNGLGGGVVGSAIPFANVDVMAQGISQDLSGVTYGFTLGNFVSYAAGTWTFAAGGTLTISQGTTPVYSAILQETHVYTIAGATRIAGATLNTSYVDGAFFESFLGFKAVPDTVTLGDLNQTFVGSTFTTGDKGPGIDFISLGGGGVEGPVAPIPASALLFAPALLGLVGIRKKFHK